MYQRLDIDGRTTFDTFEWCLDCCTSFAVCKEHQMRLPTEETIWEYIEAATSIEGVDESRFF